MDRSVEVKCCMSTTGSQNGTPRAWCRPCQTPPFSLWSGEHGPFNNLVQNFDHHACAQSNAHSYTHSNTESAQQVFSLTEVEKNIRCNLERELFSIDVPSTDECLTDRHTGLYLTATRWKPTAVYSTASHIVYTRGTKNSAGLWRVSFGIEGPEYRELLLRQVA